MFEEAQSASEGLSRQRRNLLVVSSLIAFFNFAGVKISKLSILGLEFSSFERPEALFVAIWLLFLHFLFRYWV